MVYSGTPHRIGQFRQLLQCSLWDEAFIHVALLAPAAIYFFTYWDVAKSVTCRNINSGTAVLPSVTLKACLKCLTGLCQLIHKMWCDKVCFLPVVKLTPSQLGRVELDIFFYFYMHILSSASLTILRKAIPSGTNTEWKPSILLLCILHPWIMCKKLASSNWLSVPVRLNMVCKSVIDCKLAICWHRLLLIHFN